VLVLHLHQHQSSRNLHLQYLAKNQSTQCCQSLITQGSDHSPVLEPHMVLRFGSFGWWLVTKNHFDFQPWLESINLYAKYCSAASSRIWMPAPPTTRGSLALG
jgi:hypothetical protein